MKNLFRIVLAILMVSALLSCGGSEGVEAQKAKLEQLKTKQAELNAEITALEEAIAASGESVATENNRAKLVLATPVVAQHFVHAINVQGKVDGDENITYSAKVPSTVTKIHVKAGDPIRDGQVLAELDNKAAKAQLESVKTQYELAKTVFERQKSLWEQKVGSEIQYLTAKTNKESLEKQVQSIQENLDMLTIKAEYNGTVDEVMIKVGQIVAPGLPCIVAVNPDRLKIKADLSESYAGQVRTGNPVMIYFPDIKKELKSRVSYASKSINAITRTFNVEVELPSDNTLHPNMVAELRIMDYERANTVVVPINTIQQIDDTNVVFVAVKKGNQFIAKKTTVQVGKMYDGKAEIYNGLKSGDQLITTGFQDLNDGQDIQL